MESPSIPRLTKTQRFRSSYSLKLSNSCFELSKFKSLRRFQILVSSIAFAVVAPPFAVRLAHGRGVDVLIGRAS